MPLRASLHRKPSSGRWAGRHSKRKEVLSVNMISLPMADFRHISHIGNDVQSDSFGDLSFLKRGHRLLLQSSQSEQNIFLACSPPPKPPRVNLDEPDSIESQEWSMNHQRKSQKRIKCNSMPLLDSKDREDIDEEQDRYQEENETHSTGRGSRSSNRDGDFTETGNKTVGQQKDEDSGFSFSLDLGPSILDDVLQVMDKEHNSL
ncbi:cdc42 effector protein 3 [Gouania willdenowi]|uniref:Cdc42 effector protein 3-like n=1 Tax=Gouania willdenowi TaxID=441366 RepID=A0A8C5HA45_GOUWI|nr:cdc42 effector protein 3-like [Gouania willdenowi]XP_028294263.1 cdc42 effector protein 3-like [Gouania willdenowi]